MSARFSQAASQDLKDIARYIVLQSANRETARRFIAQLREKCNQLAESPFRLGTMQYHLRPGLRSYPLGNYVILFEYRDSALEVFRILEGHRDISGIFV